MKSSALGLKDADAKRRSAAFWSGAAISVSGAVLGRELAFNEINHLSLAMIFENIHLI